MKGTNTRYQPPLWLAAIWLTTILGCAQDEEVYYDYGRRSGWAETSVNGTRTLGRMFALAGHKVRSWQYLSPSLDKADVIVWAPDDFEPPTQEVADWLYYEWLLNVDLDDEPRVLIYIGRDFDAEPDYWQRVQGRAPAGLQGEYARRLREATSRAARKRPSRLDRTELEGWFRLDPQPPPQKVTDLTGPWARGIDATRVEIHRHTRLKPAPGATVLLADEHGQPLASEIEAETYYDGDYYDVEPGRILLIENGSWLLNARLVNHEHRKLAGRLIDHVGAAPKQVVFLESDAGGPPIRDTDPGAHPPMGLELFTVWPIGAVLTQLALLGIVFALMCWPVFGVPRRLPEKSTTDFGSHVAALGRLLRDTRDRRHAWKLLRLYRQPHAGELPAGVEPLQITLPPPTEPPTR